jgi:DNA-binding transcriptional ArsR family regulator
VNGPEEIWYDDDAGPLVRLYALTGGRTVAGREDFTLSTMVQRIAADVVSPGLSPEQRRILRLSRSPVSVPEIAAHLGMPLGSVRVLLGDLRDAGLIAVPQSREMNAATSQPVLERLLNGLLSL